MEVLVELLQEVNLLHLLCNLSGPPNLFIVLALIEYVLEAFLLGAFHNTAL